MGEPRLSALLHSRGASLGLPVAGNFELTPRCNFNCKMCYIHLSPQEQARRGRELTGAEWLSIGEEAARAGMVFLLLTGGEPTLRPDFYEIYSGLKAMGLLISINSNGFLLRDDLLERLLANPPHRINVSLYGVSNETYEALCGVPAYDRVLANVKALRAGGIDVKLNLTMTPENEAEAEAIQETARLLGVHLQTATYLFPQVRVTGEPAFSRRMPPEQAARREAARLRQTTEPETLARFVRSLDLPLEEDSPCGRCRAGWSSFWLTWQGELLPCGMLPEPGEDVLTQGFQPAWDRLRRRVEALRLPPACAACPYKKLCHICLAKCYCETGGFQQAPDYPCRMTKALVRELRSQL